MELEVVKARDALMDEQLAFLGYLKHNVTWNRQQADDIFRLALIETSALNPMILARTTPAKAGDRIMERRKSDCKDHWAFS
jgi:hypothetical protein